MNLQDLVNKLVRWALEALAIAFVARYVLGRTNLNQIATLTAMVTATLVVLELFAPKVVNSTRQGMGFTLGSQLMGTPVEGMDDPEAIDYYQNNRLPTPRLNNRLDGQQGPYEASVSATSQPQQVGGGCQSGGCVDTDVNQFFHDLVLQQQPVLSANDDYHQPQQHLTTI